MTDGNGDDEVQADCDEPPGESTGHKKTASCEAAF
jgi:hypothetical protein